MTNFTKYDVAFIGIKLLAIYIALQLIGSLPSIVQIWSMSLWQAAYNKVSIPIAYIMIILLTSLFALATPIVLWIFAAKIAKFITKSKAKTQVLNADAQDLQSILLCVAGVIIFVTTMPDLIAWLYRFVVAYRQATPVFKPNWPYFPDFMAYALKTILSLILIFSAKSLSRLFNKIRYAGLKK